MNDIISSPFFGILLSLLAFEIGIVVHKSIKLPIFNPVLLATSLIIFILVKFHISIEHYNKGADFISFFLSPATVILAVPLYKQVSLLKSNSIAIISGVTVGCIISIASTILLSNAFGIEPSIGLSIIPKSVTTPIGIELSRQIGGIPSVTLITIIIAGNIGYIAAPSICNLLNINDSIAVGVSIGTSSHALGTTKAMELGEIEGAMSGLSIGLAGVVTVILAPIIINFI